MEEPAALIAFFNLLCVKRRPNHTANAHWCQLWLNQFAVKALPEEKGALLVTALENKWVLLNSLSKITNS
jgi:hypothetical protein